MAKCTNCSKRACFGILGTIDLYCKLHKKENMIDLKHKKCIKPNCKKRPTYNLINEKKAIYCNEHKLNNMINILSKICIEPDCLKQSSFNISTYKQALYCSEHKKKRYG